MLLLGVGLARNIEELAKWWTDNNHHIRALPEDERARVIAAKDRRKEELNAHPDEDVHQVSDPKGPR